MALIQRKLKQQIARFLNRKEYIAIIGPRQAGKTTFLKMLKEYLVESQGVASPNVHYLTFEDRKLLHSFRQDPIAFVRSYAGQDNKPAIIMIDEFQYAASGGQKLKLIYDTMENVKIILTGSSSLEIKAKVGKFMVGRLLTFHLFPFDFQEYLLACDERLAGVLSEKQKAIYNYLRGLENKLSDAGADPFAKQLLPFFENYATFGGYPAVVMAETETEKQKLLNDIYDNYILRDIKGLLELATEDQLYQLTRVLATQIGNLLNYQNLGKIADLDYRNLKKHLRILQETFVIRLLIPYFTNKQKELSKNPKVFFEDLGFRNSLLKSFQPLDQKTEGGATIGNVVYLLLKRALTEEAELNFWRTKAGAEVDFVMQERGEIIPIEVKYSRYDQPQISRSLAAFINNFKPPRALVVNKNYFGRKVFINCEVAFAPAYYL
ncbi:ATP-binding protein [Candidatus Saganbacteria bacterium]|nr:ATP-binding protein [Candidatus Saganbacteria bacterium]